MHFFTESLSPYDLASFMIIFIARLWDGVPQEFVPGEVITIERGQFVFEQFFALVDVLPFLLHLLPEVLCFFFHFFVENSLFLFSLDLIQHFLSLLCHFKQLSIYFNNIFCVELYLFLRNIWVRRINIFGV